MKFFQKQKQQFISQVVIIAIIFGFSAGVVGQIVADVYIDPWQQDYFYQNFNLNANVDLIPELRRVKQFLGIEQDFEVNKSINKVAPAVIGIYQKKSAGKTILGQIYLPQDLAATGFILTSDGWLVGLGEVFNSLDSKQAVVVYDGKTYAINEVIIDSTTDVAFIKISANNLPVVVLGDSDEAISGQLVIGLNGLAEAMVTNIRNINYRNLNSVNNLAVSSEQYNELILLAGNLNPSYLGSPLINLGGEVVGVVNEINQTQNLVTAVPINQFRSIILDVLKSNIIKRSFLGVNYLDLAWTVGLDDATSQELTQGALVYQNPLRTTPAAEIGLQANDIILSVDDQPVDKNSSLTELIQQYQAGDEVNLEIRRGGQTIVRPVTLGLLAD